MWTHQKASTIIAHGYILLKHFKKIDPDLHIASCLQGQWHYPPLLYPETGFPSLVKAARSWPVAVWPGSQAGVPGLWDAPAPGDSSREPTE